MRYLFLADLHSNIDAARRVVEVAREVGFDGTIVLGDLVGYGANPNEVVELIRKLQPKAIIRGNHDKVVAGHEDGEDFNPVAREAAHLNRALLTEENLKYLADLPRGPKWVQEDFMIAHGSPLDEDEYLLDEEDARLVFESAEFSVCFFGHTHIAGVFTSEDGEIRAPVGSEGRLSLAVQEEGRYLINPGSVGQPRDEDPRAGFAIFDTIRKELTLHRVAYPIETAQNSIRSAGIPPILAERLARGL